MTLGLMQCALVAMHEWWVAPLLGPGTKLTVQHMANRGMHVEN